MFKNHPLLGYIYQYKESIIGLDDKVPLTEQQKKRRRKSKLAKKARKRNRG